MKESAGNVLMLVENPYPEDTRVRNEAVTLASMGLGVIVVALRSPGEPWREEMEGVTVYRIPRVTLFNKLPKGTGSWIQALLMKAAIFVGYVTEYLYFTTACLLVSCYVALRHGFHVIHANNPPDTLFVVGAFHKLFGRKFVFDHHDLSAELYESRNRITGGIVPRALRLCERISARLADLVIATNESYRAISIARNGVDPADIVVVRNGPDLNRVKLVAPDAALRARASVLLGYVGEINPQDGLDYMLRALAYLRHDLGRSDFYCVAMGSGDSLEEMKSLSIALGLQDHVEFTGYVPDEQMLRYLSTVDICIDPNPSSPLNDVSTWIKVMEYMALGKPVVSFDLKETRVSADDAALYATPNDEAEFAAAIATLIDDAPLRKRMGTSGVRRVTSRLNWQESAKHLVAGYNRLFPAWRPRETPRLQHIA